MQTTKITGIRYCFRCKEETDHELVYLEQYLKAGRCLICGAEFNNRGNLFKVYIHDLIERILTKPYRVYYEFETQPVKSKRRLSLYKDMIKRVFVKPSAEIQNLIQIWRKYRF